MVARDSAGRHNCQAGAAAADACPPSVLLLLLVLPSPSGSEAAAITAAAHATTSGNHSVKLCVAGGAVGRRTMVVRLRCPR